MITNEVQYRATKAHLERFEQAAANLAARGFDLVLIVVSPVAAARALVRSGPVAEVAARVWALEHRAYVDDLRRDGLTVVDWDGVEPLEAALARWHRPRLRGARA